MPAARVAARLGQDEAALDGGERRGGERRRVGARPQLPAGRHRLEPRAQRRLPARVAVGQELGSRDVVLGQLAGQATDGTPSSRLTVDLQGDEAVEQASIASHVERSASAGWASSTAPIVRSMTAWTRALALADRAMYENENQRTSARDPATASTAPSA
jgi:hypothetical protein